MTELAAAKCWSPEVAMAAFLAAVAAFRADLTSATKSRRVPTWASFMAAWACWGEVMALVANPRLVEKAIYKVLPAAWVQVFCCSEVQPTSKVQT